MKIIRNDEKYTKITDIKSGELFKAINSGNIYLKTNETYENAAILMVTGQLKNASAFDGLQLLVIDGELHI